MKNIKSYEEFVNENLVNEEISLDDMKKAIKKIVGPALLGTALVGGMASCTKPVTNYIYKYSYEVSPGKEVSNMYAFDRELSPEEIAEIDKKGDEIMSKHWSRDIDGNLEFYKIDPNGDYQTESPSEFLKR